MDPEVDPESGSAYVVIRIRITEVGRHAFIIRLLTERDSITAVWARFLILYPYIAQSNDSPTD